MIIVGFEQSKEAVIQFYGVAWKYKKRQSGFAKVVCTQNTGGHMLHMNMLLPS